MLTNKDGREQFAIWGVLVVQHLIGSSGFGWNTQFTGLALSLGDKGITRRIDYGNSNFSTIATFLSRYFSLVDETFCRWLVLTGPLWLILNGKVSEQQCWRVELLMTSQNEPAALTYKGLYRNENQVNNDLKCTKEDWENQGFWKRDIKRLKREKWQGNVTSRSREGALGWVKEKMNDTEIYNST